MKNVICRLRGHDRTPVADDGVVDHIPGQTLPQFRMRYRADAFGPHRACRRCGLVERATTPLCDATGTYRDSEGRVTCDQPAGHLGAHTDPIARQQSRSGSWGES